MENQKLYPLTPSQMSIFLAWKYSFHKNVMNVPTSFFTETRLDLELLKKAAAAAIQRNDAFGIRITKSGKDRMQYFTDHAANCLEIIDFTGKTAAAMQKFFDKTAQTAMPLDDKPLTKLYIVRAPDGRCGIYMVASHLVLDSWAISMFYKDVIAVYFAMKNGSAMPKAPASCESTLQKDIAYLKTPRHEADAEFWKNESIAGSPMPMFTSINGPEVLAKFRQKKKDPTYCYGPSFTLRTKAEHAVIMIDKAAVDQMKAFCVTNNVPTMQVLFLMGYRTFLSSVNNRAQDVSIFNTVARRGTLEEKTSGGTRIHFVSFRTRMDESLTFKAALDILMEKQLSLYRHADFNPLQFFEMEYAAGRKPMEDYHAGCLTFQPVPMEINGLEKVTTRWYCNGAAGQALYLTIMDGDGTGALRCYYEYQTSQHKPAAIRRFHNHMVKIILAGVANPAMTIKELLDIPVSDA